MNKSMPLLIIHTDGFSVIGGANFHTIYFYKTLLSHGINAILLVSANSKMEDAVKNEKLPYRTISHFGILRNKLFFKLFLTKKLITICRNLGPCIVICCNKAEIWAAKIVRLFTPITIIYHRHSFDVVSHHRLANIDMALGSGQQTVAMLHQQNRRINYSIKYIDDLPMFYNQEKFLNYQPAEDRAAFFKKHFCLNIPQEAVILCSIGNLYAKIHHKNYPLLFSTVARINENRSSKIQVVLAGNGPTEKYLKNLAYQTGVNQEVHFLGFTDQIPAILYHSDIFVHASKAEAFGIVHLEAALMKKPLVGATNTGAENTIILHEKTGLLFKNNDLDDLVFQLERLIANTKLRSTLGVNAYEHVRMLYSNEVGLQKMLGYYQKIITSQNSLSS